ncbi:MAG: hypothetical protein AAGJ53_09910, partial [Pseudomonadota bacterium]
MKVLSTRQIVSACPLLAVAPLVSGELLLYEGFDYATSSNLVGQNGGDWDATRAWQTAGSSNGSINAATVVTGLSLSDYPVTGNAGQVVNNHNSGSNYAPFIAGRQLPATLSTPSGSDVWVSFLFQQDESGSFANESQLSFGQTIDSTQQFMQSRFLTLFGDNAPDNVSVGVTNG